MKKQKEINPCYKTVIFDYDGTLCETSVMQKYAAETRKYPRFSPDWVKARKEYLSHIGECSLYEGWNEVFEFLKANNIQAAIVSGNNREVLNLAVKHFGLRELFPKEKVNRIGCRDVNGYVVRKRGGNPTLFEFALSQLNAAPCNVLSFGNELCDAQAASKTGITAYNCLWGAVEEERELMLKDTEHKYLTSPKQIIDILKETYSPS